VIGRCPVHGRVGAIDYRQVEEILDGLGDETRLVIFGQPVVETRGQEEGLGRVVVAECLGRHPRGRRRRLSWADRYLEELVVNGAVLHGTKSCRCSGKSRIFTASQRWKARAGSSGDSDPRT